MKNYLKNHLYLDENDEDEGFDLWYPNCENEDEKEEIYENLFDKFTSE